MLVEQIYEFLEMLVILLEYVPYTYTISLFYDWEVGPRYWEIMPKFPNKIGDEDRL